MQSLNVCLCNGFVTTGGKRALMPVDKARYEVRPAPGPSKVEENAGAGVQLQKVRLLPLPHEGLQGSRRPPGRLSPVSVHRPLHQARL